MPGRFLCAVVLALSGAHALAQSSVTQTQSAAQPTGPTEFVRVPPVWWTPAGDGSFPWITAAAVCRYKNPGAEAAAEEKAKEAEKAKAAEKPNATAQATAEEKAKAAERVKAEERAKARVKLSFGGVDLAKIPCEPVSSDYLEIPDLKDPKSHPLFQAALALVEVNDYCQTKENAGKTPCPDLFVAARPKMAGREKVSAIGSDQEDRDLDGSQRLAPSSDATAMSAEARFVEGLTNFVLDRAKLEAIAYFEERFHTTLCEGDSREPRVSYFTSVCHVLSNSKGAGFSLASASREMRAAARRDLRALPDAALHQQYINSARPLYAMMRVWLGLASRLRDSTLEPTEAFAALANINSEICDRNDNWVKGDARDQEVMRALESRFFVEKYGQFAPPPDFDKLSTAERAARVRKPGADPDAIQKLARRAIVQECGQALQANAVVGSALSFAVKERKDRKVSDLIDVTVLAYRGRVPPPVEFRNRPDFVAVFISALNALEGLSVEMEKFKVQAENARTAARAARTEQGAKRDEALRKFGAELTISADQFLDLLDGSILAFVGCKPEVCLLDGAEIRQRTSEGIRVARQNARLARDVLNDQWVVVAVEISRLYLTRADGPAGALLGQYAPVIAEIAGAKTSVEVQKILNDAAAPAGSYREKFRGNTRSISALVGASLGTEWYRSEEVHGSANIIGLFAPVGLHITTPLSERGGCKIFCGAIGVFGSLLDLGPYASYRESEQGVTKNSEVGLEQVFSPGVYLTWSISYGSSRSLFYRSPFVVGFGIARTPALLQTTSGQDIDSTRVLGFIAIDVPMFPF